MTLRVGWGATLPLAAALALGIGGLSLIRLAARPLGILIIAIAVAEALEPLVGRLQRRMRRGFAIALVFLGLVALAGLTGALVVPTLISQGQALVTHAPEIASNAQRWLARADAATHGAVTRFVTGGETWVAHVVVQLPAALFSIVTDLLVVIFLCIYWLAGSPGLVRFSLSLVPAPRRASARTLIHDMGQSMGGYIRGAAINAVIMGVLATVGLLIIGVNFPVALGVLTGLGEPFPYVGPFAAAVPVVLVAFFQSPTKALIALGLYVFLQEFEGHVLTPNVMRSQTAIPQALVILAIVVGAALGGLLGIIVAIPTAAALHVFTLRVIVPGVQRLTGAAGEPPDDSGAAAQ